MPTYNRADLIRDAVTSVLAQSHVNFELIVVDDGSQDDTRQVIEPFLSDARLRYVYQDNGGRAQARNHGAAVAQGDYIGFLDSDDQYSDNALAAHVRGFDADSSIGMTLGGYDYISLTGATLGERRPWEEAETPSLSAWLFNCLAIPGSVMVRRGWLERVGKFDPACEIAEDWDLFLRLALMGCPMTWVRESVCRYRLHAGNSIHHLTKHQEGAVRSLKKAFSARGFPAELVGLQGRALAQIHINHARKALALGQTAAALTSVLAACQEDGGLLSDRQIDMWEMLLTPVPEFGAAPTDGIDDLIARLRTLCRVDGRALGRARARLAMRQFFTARGRGDNGEAERQLRAALRHDLAWLANRGVLVFVAERALGDPWRLRTPRR